MKRILVVDDEPAILTLLTYNLKKENFEVVGATTGTDALEIATTQKFDFIILDLMLPGIDGMEVTKKLRQAQIQTPIMILTAKDSETDKILGLELGADDYVTKPFSPREIVARIHAIERRTKPAETQKHQYTVGNITIDTQKKKVFVDQKAVQLTHKEFDLLNFFMHHVDQVISRDQLLQEVWGMDYLGETRVVDIQVSHLRDKIEKDPKHPLYLETVRGFGYIFGANHD